jgi:hypothetical protein
LCVISSIHSAIPIVKSGGCHGGARAGPFATMRIRGRGVRIENLGVPKRSTIAVDAVDVPMLQDQPNCDRSLWPGNCVKEGMNCPFCRIALKAAAHRGTAVTYCPLCGGTWVEHMAFENLTSPVRSRRRFPGWLLRVVLFTALMMIGCLIGAVAAGAVRVWPTLRNWTESLLTGNETVLNAQVRRLADRMGNPCLTDLSRAGLDPAIFSRLIADSGFKRLLNSAATLPQLMPAVKNGEYLKALQEATRQNVPNVCDVKLDGVGASDVRIAVARVQKVLSAVPAARAAGNVEPAVMRFLESAAFQELSRNGMLDRLFGSSGRAPAAD